jgi:hypothetical protein
MLDCLEVWRLMQYPKMIHSSYLTNEAVLFQKYEFDLSWPTGSHEYVHRYVKPSQTLATFT